MHYNLIYLILITNCIRFSCPKIILQKYCNPYIYCAVHITRFINEQKFLVVHNNEDDIQSLIRNINMNNNTLILQNLKRHIVRHSDIILQDVYIFTVKTIANMYNIINMFNYSEYWNPRAKFLILFYGNESIDSIFDIFWYNSILNVVVLRKDINALQNSTIEIFSYYPYANGKCKNVSKVKLDYPSCDNITNINELFPEKVPPDLMGCELKYGTSVFKPMVIEPNATDDNARVIGYETCLMRTFLEKVNYTGNLECKYKNL